MEIYTKWSSTCWTPDSITQQIDSGIWGSHEDITGPVVGTVASEGIQHLTVGGEDETEKEKERVHGWKMEIIDWKSVILG